jgi:hypothetical protein
MKQAIYLIVVLFSLSCNQESSNVEEPKTVKEQDRVNVEKESVENNESTERLKPPFYIINTAAVKLEVAAIKKAQVLRDDGYKADYLWIPDYGSLSGAEFFSVFLGPYKTKEECAIILDKYQSVNPKAYGTLVSYDSKREVVHGLTDAVQ